MMRTANKPLRAGFTLIELMIVLAVMAVLLLVVAPSFREMLEVQRVKGVSDAFITDVQFARSEAASRQERVGISFKPGTATLSCYIVHTCGSFTDFNCKCNCAAAAGSRCPDPSVVNDPPREIRTVQFPADSQVRLTPTLANGNPPTAAGITHLNFDPATGALFSQYAMGLVVVAVPPNGEFWAQVSPAASGSTTIVRDIINPTGRPIACKPTTSTITGIKSC